MKIKALRGTKDILPEESRFWGVVEHQAKGLCEIYGYREIRTPLLEEARLFMRSIGAGSDIVRKEMYCFLDRKKRMLSLRPEATASVVRAYLEHGFDQSGSLAKFYYLGPMFRAERPQAGRLRQFHHLGVEAIGSASPYLDAEVISLAAVILKQIGINEYTLQLNSIGCAKDRERYKQLLKENLKGGLRLLCLDCRQRYKTNLLRVFDCKNAACKKITDQLPTIANLLCLQCQEHFAQVQQILQLLDIAYVFNPRLVRGLDYYTKTCFEVVHEQLGAQNALGAGGRYDTLVHDLGGPQRPAVGFAFGLERLITVLKPATNISTDKSISCVYIAVVGDLPRQRAAQILYSLRKQGIGCEMDYQAKSLKGQMRQADKLQVRYVLIIGEDELNRQTAILRNMQDKSQREIKIEDIVKELKTNCQR